MLSNTTPVDTLLHPTKTAESNRIDPPCKLIFQDSKIEEGPDRGVRANPVPVKLETASRFAWFLPFQSLRAAFSHACPFGQFRLGQNQVDTEIEPPKTLGSFVWKTHSIRARVQTDSASNKPTSNGSGKELGIHGHLHPLSPAFGAFEP
jgi:hypothetical protein